MEEMSALNPHESIMVTGDVLEATNLQKDSSTACLARKFKTAAGRILTTLESYLSSEKRIDVPASLLLCLSQSEG